MWSVGPGRCLIVFTDFVQCCSVTNSTVPCFPFLYFFSSYSGGWSPCNFWTSTVNRIFYSMIGILRLRAIDWYINEFNRRGSGGGGGQGGFDFLGPPLQNFTGALSQDYKYIFGILGSRAVDWHPVSSVRWNGWGIALLEQTRRHGAGRPTGASHGGLTAVSRRSNTPEKEQTVNLSLLGGTRMLFPLYNFAFKTNSSFVKSWANICHAPAPSWGFSGAFF